MQLNKECFEAESETTSLLRANQNGNLRKKKSRKYRVDDICITSKAAWLTLLWSFCIGILYGLASNPPSGLFYRLTSAPSSLHPLVNPVFVSVVYVINGISLCFYPLSGYLADNVVGKYKMIIRSLKLLLVALLMTLLPITIFTILLVTGNSIAGLIGLIVVPVLFYIVMNITFIGFNANVIQFGMEQVHDSPAHHQSLFIFWYVWIYYLVQLLIVQPWNLSNIPYEETIIFGLSLFGVFILFSFVTIASSLCVAHCGKNWFLITPSEVSPYKLVYKVTRFARQLKAPIRRSAFTYCEDDIPAGLDLAKDKYGGPFTTEEVENVKAFYGILKILLSLGPVFFFTYAADPALYYYVRLLLKQISWRADRSTMKLIYHYFFDDNTLSSIVVIIFIPLYIAALHLLQCRYHLSMLKRIGLGTIFLIMTLISIVPLLSTLLYYEKRSCISVVNENISTFGVETHVVGYILPVLPRCLYGVSNLFLYTALYEFICAQSPPSMKGLLIGLSFAIKGIFQAIGAAFAIPFFIPDFIGCNMWYYGINIALAIVTLVIFSYFARRYQYRQRDDICDVYRYAEEYYSNTQEEQFYD